MNETALLILDGESSRRCFSIVEFSMLEPSAMHCRFKTDKGEILESHGQLISYTGNICCLPPQQ
jgi:hypothetical protein